MAKQARVKLKKPPHTESVISVKAYDLLKKKYTLIGYEDSTTGELTEVQRIMADRVSKKKDAENAEGNSTNVEEPVTDTAKKPVTSEPDAELEELREQYKAKFGKAANKNFKVETLKAKINEG
jgi:hypothetical protein